VYPDPEVAKAIDTVQRGLYLVISMGTAGVVAVRWWASSTPGRRAMLPSVGGAVCLLLWSALLAVDLVVGGARHQVLLWCTACSIALVPVAFLVGLLRSRLARGGLADLFGDLVTMQPPQLQAALARVLHDPAFAIAYADPGGGFVDVHGASADLPGPASGRSVSHVVRDGVAVAALVYDRSLDDDPELVEAVGGAATIALENRLLQAQSAARLAELQASRQRLVTAADAERRRIERDLHDGAQQRLVTLALQLSLIQRRIRDDPGDAEQLVAGASDELARSLAELRELARGIHPAALEQGLQHALEGLVLRSPVPAELVADPGPRLPRPVEFAAYFVASEALANVGKYARASAVVVRLTRTGSGAVVAIADDGVGGADPAGGSGLRGLADRVEALGGRLVVTSPPGEGTVVTAELPTS
jgi:signal transduction histidine kinase